MNENDCGLCSHAAHEHDGMGDCHHLDGRTVTGYCNHAEGVSA